MEGRDHLVEDLALIAESQALHVLKHEGVGVEFAHDAHEFLDEGIARIVERTLADHRESLTRRSAKDRVDAGGSDARCFANFGTAQADNRPG